jgi:hypothetical protein
MSILRKIDAPVHQNRLVRSIFWMVSEAFVPHNRCRCESTQCSPMPSFPMTFDGERPRVRIPLRQLAGTRTRYRRADATPLAGLIFGRTKVNDQFSTSIDSTLHQVPNDASPETQTQTDRADRSGVEVARIDVVCQYPGVSEWLSDGQPGCGRN